MKKAINLAVVEKGGLLLVRKKNVWILPGGKPDLSDKCDYGTLVREFEEELPGTEIFVDIYYDSFFGKTPHSNSELEAKVYLGRVKNLGEPSAEISEAKYIKNFEKYNLSNITEEIVLSLIKDNYLKNGK